MQTWRVLFSIAIWSALVMAHSRSIGITVDNTYTTSCGSFPRVLTGPRKYKRPNDWFSIPVDACSAKSILIERFADRLLGRQCSTSSPGSRVIDRTELIANGSNCMLVLRLVSRIARLVHALTHGLGRAKEARRARGLTRLYSNLREVLQACDNPVLVIQALRQHETFRKRCCGPCSVAVRLEGRTKIAQQSWDCMALAEFATYG